MFLGDSLIFIISQPRTGSTLLQRVLASHPEIHTGAESWIMLHPIYGLREKGIWTQYNHRSAYRAVRDFLDIHCGGKQAYYDATRAFSHVLYTRALEKSQKRFFVDKAPPYTHIIPELSLLFPKAKFIFLLRNPLAVLSSFLSTWIKGNWLNLWWGRHDLLEAPVNILRGIDDLKDLSYVIHYEEMVTNPHTCIFTLCQYLGVDYFDGMLTYGKWKPPLGAGPQKIPGQRVLMGDQTGIHRHKGPVRDSLNNWKSLAENPQTCHFGLAYLEELGREIVETMGYSFEELQSELKRTNSNHSMPQIPWQIAIKEPSTRSTSERLKTEWVMSLKKYGFTKGPIRFIQRNMFPLFRKALGRL